MIEAYKGKRIGVIQGGYSAERAVSLRSGQNVYDALQRMGYDVFQVDPALRRIGVGDMDVAFIMLHGQFGEDGGIQAHLEQLGIPYTGSGVQASVIGMNKLLSKQQMAQLDIPTPAYQIIGVANEEAVSQLGFPLIAKPFGQGSSVDVSIADDAGDYARLKTSLLGHYGNFMIEEFIDGKEITVGVLERDGMVFSLPILELRTMNRFYDYDAKYTPGKTTFVLPAELDPNTEKHCRDLAERFHRFIGARGMSRVDMRVHPERGPFVLEINTIPGMTDTSDLPAQAQQAGIGFDELVEIVLSSARVSGV